MTERKNKIQPDIRFPDIRPLDGKQSQGFEELCFQLLPWLIGETLVGLSRVDGRGGDGGVEAIAKTASGLDVGLQCKYITSLSDVQWRQIDKSVRTVIDKHPEVLRYLVCVPLNRTPGQIRKWDSLLSDWRGLAPSLAVEWVGASELFEHLLKPEASHLRTYWFSCPEFSADWVTAQTQTAIRQLHDRYTPSLHKPTSAEERLEFLAASPKAKDFHRNQCSELVAVWRHALKSLSDEIKKQNATANLAELLAAFDAMLVDMREGDLVAQRDELVAALGKLGEKTEQSVQELFPGERPSPGPYWSFRRDSRLDDGLEKTARLIKSLSSYFQAQRQIPWVLTGEAGTGKSHLLADLAKKLLVEGRACLLMVGERFATDSPLVNQIPALLNWGWSLGDLLACLSAHAAISGRVSLLMVDAINEPRGSALWRRELLALSAFISEYPGVRLLVSCRSDCLDSSLPPDVLNEHNTIRHNGFDLQFHEAVQAYFEGYQVISPQFPTLNPEFQNPLFLKTLCGAYKGKTLPLGVATFVGVLDAWEARVVEDIEQKLDCPRRATQRAIEEIVLALARSDAKRISADAAEELCRKQFSDQRASHSLYRYLNSEGLLQEVEAQGETVVRLQYERFSDVRIAQMVLKGIASKPQWLAHWTKVFLPSRMDGDGLDWDAEPELTAFALLLPEAIGMELVECPVSLVVRSDWARRQAKNILWDAWLGALPWRALAPTDEKIPRFFAVWANKADDVRQVWEKLFQFACIPDHPLNADFLHKHLNKLDLPARELQWTVSLAKEDPDDQIDGSVVGPFLYWVDAAVGKASDEQVRLAVQVLLWMTSSPNRELRDRATDVAIRSLAASQQAEEVCTHLLENFWEVNDPYVKERLLAVMCGVLPALSSSNAKPIAELVLRRFWLVDAVEPHLLQREYAAFVVRHACEAGLLSREYLELLERGPHKSKPVVWTEEQVDTYAQDTGYGEVLRSLVPEEMGNYGDFGRYVMGTAVHQFADDERAESSTKGLFRGNKEHDARFARRYIFQRVTELGWTPDRYSEFERGLGYSSRIGGEGRIERISKKYQWIGFHEYLGHLSDSLMYKEWGADLRPLRGAWELHCRNYDPGLALGNAHSGHSRIGVQPSWVAINPIVAVETGEEKTAWVQSPFESFNPYLTLNYEGTAWVVLHTHLNFEEALGFGKEQSTSGQMSQWVDVRAFLIPNSKVREKQSLLTRLDFYGDGCDLPKVSQCWTSEYPWHHAFQEADASCIANDTWFRGLDEEGLFLPVCEIVDDDRSVLLPAPTLYRELSEVLGRALSAPRVTAGGRVDICDTTGHTVFKAMKQGGSVLLVDQSALMRYLTARNLTLVWGVLSEKSAWNGSQHVGGLANQSAVYTLKEDGTVSGKHTVRNATLRSE